MKTLAVNDSGEIYLDEKGNIAVVDDLEGLRQKVMSVLKMIRGEWVLDVTAGVPYMESILIKGADEATVKNIYDKAILEVDGVIAITESSGVLERRTRRYSYSATVSTIYGRLGVTNG